MTNPRDKRPAEISSGPGEESRRETSAPRPTARPPSTQTVAGVSEVRGFPGFQSPDRNWSKLPHALIGALSIIQTVSELKVILYVLRHTWGYQEYDITKRITIDEFRNGRKRRDGIRIDNGTGLSCHAVRDGVRRAVAHGFLVQENETHRDRGRRSYVYRLNMVNTDTRGVNSAPLMVKDGPPDGQTLPPRASEFAPRSEKETTERNNGKKQEEKAASSVTCSIHNAEMQLRTKNGDQWYSHRSPDGRWCKGAPGDQPGDGNGRNDQRHNGTTTAICPSCSLVRAVECICPDCEQCWYCCTCA